LGILTAKAESGSASATWTAPSTGGLDGLSRLAESQNTLINRPAYGQAVGAGFVVATLDGDPVAVQFDGSASNGLWRANLDMASGSHTLAVTALDPSGYFAGSSNSSFTVASGAVDTVTNTYDGNGNITQRVWINNLGKTNRIETLTWDAFDRMIQETDRDTNNSGWNFVCIYDGLGRRVRAIETFVTNGVAITSPASSVSTVDSWYDPQVEFLEVAVNVNSNVTVKTYGPDNSGAYGGMQGVGGLEAIYGTGYVQSLGSVQDYFGNVIGTITNGGVLWNPARFSSYGPVPGYQPLSLSLNTTVAQTVGWHGLHIDPDGNYHIGARRYGPTEGRWLSADPFGHSASMDLYSYCGGDPVNFGDADGRFGIQAWNYSAGAVKGFEQSYFGISVTPPANASEYSGQQAGRDVAGGLALALTLEGAGNTGAGLGGMAISAASVPATAGIDSPVAGLAFVGSGALTVEGLAQMGIGAIGLYNFNNLTPLQQPSQPQGSSDGSSDDTSGPQTQLRDPDTGRFITDPNNPSSPFEFTDAQRRAAWKQLAQDPNSPLDDAQRAQIKARGWRGPQRINPATGQLETMELSHEPVPLREGGTEVVPRWPKEHAAVDPNRQLGN
jgi:RHS repeat-associated protein